MMPVNDKELARIRLRFIDLCKSFFLEQPDAEKLGRWRGIISALGNENINPGFDKAVRQMEVLLSRKNLHDLQQEYYRLFVDPFNKWLVHTSASFYEDGHAFGPTLVRYRDFLGRAGLRLQEDVHEADDSLVLLLDALASLIDREQKNPENSRNLEAELIHGYLLSLSRKFSKSLQENPEADFYRACSELLCRYIDMERGLFTETEAAA